MGTERETKKGNREPSARTGIFLCFARKGKTKKCGSMRVKVQNAWNHKPERENREPTAPPGFPWRERSARDTCHARGAPEPLVTSALRERSLTSCSQKALVECSTVYNVVAKAGLEQPAPTTQPEPWYKCLHGMWADPDGTSYMARDALANMLVHTPPLPRAPSGPAHEQVWTA